MLPKVKTIKDNLIHLFFPANIIQWLWLKKIIWVTGVLRRTVVSDWRFNDTMIGKLGRMEFQACSSCSCRLGKLQKMCIYDNISFAHTYLSTRGFGGGVKATEHCRRQNVPSSQLTTRLASDEVLDVMWYSSSFNTTGQTSFGRKHRTRMLPLSVMG